MKSTILILFLCAQIALAQEQEKFSRQELGLAFSNFKFDNVGLRYRIGSDQGLWTIGLGSYTSGSTEEVLVDTLIRSSEITERRFYLSIGREKRFLVAEGLNIRIGANFRYGRMNYARAESSLPISESSYEVTSNSYSIGAVLGTIYQLNQNIFIGFEYMPNFLMLRSKTTNFVRDDANDVAFDLTHSVSTNTLNLNFNSTTFLFNIGFNF